MSKRRRARQESQGQVKAPTPRPGDLPPSLPREAAEQQKPRRAWLAVLLLVVLIVIGGAAVAVWQSGRAPAALPTPVPTVTPTPGPIGGVDGCRAGPRFQNGLNLSKQAALATSLTNVKGLAILDPAGSNGQGSIYQHETWDDAGFLGPFITDRHGDIYTAPTPLVSLVDNPPELQNRIYRVDSDSQVMAKFLELPSAQPSSGANPFGVVGLAYDCETESLYATSLAGSTAGQEAGRIFHIDLKTQQVLDQLEGVDAIGVGVFNGAGGKRLYFGTARTPAVRSIALDAQGNFVGEPRDEFSFARQVVGGRRTVRRIRFLPSGEMTLNAMDFNYSLQVASKRQEDVLTYRYDPATDRWTFVKIEAAQ
jgi:hypothetical protein